MASKATDILYCEHDVILDALDAADRIGVLLGKNDEEFLRRAESLLKFFREYGDQYHHKKEEEYLFPEMMKKNELIGEGILAEMLENHSDFREMLARTEKCLKSNLLVEANEIILKYSQALRDHIAVENDEVFQMAETLLTEEECVKLGHRFDDADRELGLERKEELVELAVSALKI
mgnify:CR=1 FL=1